MNRILLITIASSMALAGCGNSAPDCASEDAKDLVVDISYDEMTLQAGKQIADSVEYEVINIRTTDSDEKTGAKQCAADLELTGDKLSKTLPIQYTVENVDDGGFYVTVYGL